ncbi:MAG TPA: gamma-glutamylcyclotransferase family protein [Candidatus Eisenbacteria bacterium]|nr:gamma-glutamylcyclotransferase family protein [Candidatus Eisenbacteria bacterium]
MRRSPANRMAESGTKNAGSFKFDRVIEQLRAAVESEFEYSVRLAPVIERRLLGRSAGFAGPDEEWIGFLDTALDQLKSSLERHPEPDDAGIDGEPLLAVWFQLLSRAHCAALRMYIAQSGYNLVRSTLIEARKTRPDCIAFYGTLMASHGLQQKLGVKRSLRFLGPCTVRGALRNLGAYPALVEGNGVVNAELYEVLDPAAFKSLDDYEGFDPSRPEGSLYVRRPVRLQHPEVDCWVYYYNGRRNPRQEKPRG